MITVTIRQAAERRGIKNAYQFGQSLGVHQQVAVRIWENTQQPKLATLDRICNAWGCDLKELIVYSPDKKTNGHTTSRSPKKAIQDARKGLTKASKATLKRSR